MIKKEALEQPGEHFFTFKGANSHCLEALLVVPEQKNYNYVAILGHPHSLQGGNMQNKVVTTLARTFKELGIASIRFNFRGVGNSEGLFNAGIGESEDMLVLVNNILSIRPAIAFIFAGFSFGSYVAYRVATQVKHRLLITVAPPVNHFDYQEFNAPKPWVIVQGENDEIVPPSLIYEFCEKINPPLFLLGFSNTGHFFHGKLIELKDRLKEFVSSKVTL